MDILNTTFFFIVAIFILVTVHELGHFLTAKLFGMRVDKFYIGFDFFNLRLWKKKIGETEYGIGVFPLGGYVKIAGMVDESLDTTYQSSEPEPWEFRAKPVWQRLIVLAGGVGMNIVLAAAIFTGVTLMFGESRTTVNNPAYIEKGSVFAVMGMQTGDRIAAVNGKEVASWEEALDPASFTASSLNYTVLRDEKRLTLAAPANILSLLNENKPLGIRPLMPPVIDDVLANDPAAKAGIKPGALITAINGKPVSDWTEVVSVISAHAGKPIAITWKYLEPVPGKATDPAAILASGTPVVTEVVPTAAGKIGIALRQTLETERISLNVFESIGSGTSQTWKMSVMTVQGFARIFTGQEDFRKSLGGPVKIAKIAGRSAEQGPISFLYFLAVLSISLAIINILPIPALDGGQFVMNAIEGIIGRELPFEVKMRIQQIGMALLLTLFVYILLNDIINP
ncbi:MAG: RIP metalloprotease RseP [Chlorobium limicola]|uniref:Zinc metalloprotease n=1 Tax=Chlorobium limicola (strain DSM 245 / NBRC 103803 / 6330) TaxID=290315 RepID=B3EE56_CHLL2|nr:RIP metalloprotease RseP [Chlorobium limicola]ACD89190.1 membrane-associated zinc metalloprotease [Chlorobium limicola DSM 245]NTV07473.1 RIP metalloprotease RseP [Chlorobium limicola]NTV21590.1 RIP metalloprotease RseP [Chlorobium limicola]